DGQSWYAFRWGCLFRILTMYPTNPQQFPILGSYYIANIPTFTQNAVSDSSMQLIQRIKEGPVRAMPSYWNPMVTQQDIHRALAYPLASAPCTSSDIQALLPGFIPMPAGVALPSWTDQVYIEGWTLYIEVVPYRTRVCYLWTGDDNSKQQSIFIGNGGSALPN